MALIKTGAIVTDISGKIGGQTFGKGASGNYIKNTGSYKNAVTSKRKKANALLSAITSQWRNLTDLQRSNWSDLAKQLPYVNRVGVQSFYSGFNLFTRFNSGLQAQGSSILTDAPKVSVLKPPTDQIITLSGGKVLLQYRTGDDGVAFKLSCTPAMSNGSNQYKNKLRLVLVDELARYREPVDIAENLQAVFGKLQESAKYVVSGLFYDKSTGQPLGSKIITSFVFSAK